MSSTRYVRTRPSGIGSYVSALIQRLPELSPESRFHLWTHPECPRPIAARNVSYRTVSRAAAGPLTLLKPAALDRLWPEDVIHFPFSLLGRGLPCASVVTVHDLMWVEEPSKVDARPVLNRVRAAFYRVGMQGAMANATRLIAVSQATADRMVHLHPACRDRLRAIHNAAGPAFVPSASFEAARQRAAEIIGNTAHIFWCCAKADPTRATASH